MGKGTTMATMSGQEVAFARERVSAVDSAAAEIKVTLCFSRLGRTGFLSDLAFGREGMERARGQWMMTT